MKILNWQHLHLTLHVNILNNPKSYIHWYLKHCQKIAPYVKFYQKQIEYYNKTTYAILEKEIGLILPTYNKRNKKFIGTLLGSLASGVIGLAFEGISSFLHHKRHKALTKAVNVMKEKPDLQHNRVYHLEDTMIMYSKYNSDMLMDLINTGTSHAEFNLLERENVCRKNDRMG